MVKLIPKLLPPINYKGVQQIKGHVGYYCLFILFFVKIVIPLYKVCIDFKGENERQESYEKLQHALSLAPIIK